MVLTTTLLDLADDESLDIFDSITHAAFGDGTTTPTITDSTLVNELFRNSIESSTKSLGNNTYEFELRVPITKLNGQTISELGLFDAASSGNMGGRTLVSPSISKVADDEYVFKLRIKVQSINN